MRCPSARAADTRRQPRGGDPKLEGNKRLEELENDLGVAVVSSTAAVIWHSFKILNIRARIAGHGSLLASLSEAKEL